MVYVYGRKDIDVEDCVKQLAACLHTTDRQNQTVLLKIDVAYAHAAGEYGRRLTLSWIS